MPLIEIRPQRLPSASLYGALTGLIYALLDYAVVVVRPMTLWGPISLGPDHWIWEAAFLSVYVVLGGIIGAITAIFNTKEPHRRAMGAVVAVALIALVALRASTESWSISNLVFDAALVLLAVAALTASSSRPWLAWMSYPWVAFSLALVLIREKDSSSSVLLIGGIWAGAAAIVFVLSQFGWLRRTLRGRSLPMGAAVSGVLLVACVSLTQLFNTQPRIPIGKNAGSPSVRPNILLIVLDTVRADHLSVYGYERRTTPNLERLSPEGVLFRNAISAADFTLSSHASMFTGLNASWHGAHSSSRTNPGHLDASFQTLAEVLSDNGYTNIAVLANVAYLRTEFGLAQGFDLYDVRQSLRKSSVGAGGTFYLRPLVKLFLSHFASTAEVDRVYRRADQITSESLRAIDTMQARNRPFFLSVNYMDAHDPYVPPPPFRDYFPGRQPGFKNQRVYPFREELAKHTAPDSNPTLAHISSQYDGAIAFMDAEVNRLLNGLKQSGLYGNTLIIVTSDHGEGLGERGVQGHPASVHQELVHVPLWIKFPQTGFMEPGRQIESVVSGVDLMPTVLDVAGISVPPGLQGQSLRNLDQNPHRPVISESFVYDSLSRLRGRSDAGQRALYLDSWKLIATTTGKKELYNWKTDPAESIDVINTHPQIARQLDEQLEHWLQLAPRRKPPASKVNRQTTERLRGLGYVQ